MEVDIKNKRKSRKERKEEERRAAARREVRRRAAERAGRSDSSSRAEKETETGTRSSGHRYTTGAGTSGAGRRQTAGTAAGSASGAARRQTSGSDPYSGYRESNSPYTEEELAYYRRRRAAAARRRRERKRRRRRRIIAFLVVVVLLVVGGTVCVRYYRQTRAENALSSQEPQADGNGGIFHFGEGSDEDADSAAARQQAALAASREQAAAAEEAAQASTDAASEIAAAQTSAGETAAQTEPEEAGQAAGEGTSAQSGTADAAAAASGEQAAQEQASAAATDGSTGSTDPDVAAFHPGVDFTTDAMQKIKSEEETEEESEERSGIVSQYAVLVDLDQGTVIAGKNATTRMNPASMTKILTLLVAVENLDQSKLDSDTVKIDSSTIDYVYSKGMSAVGWEEGDTPTIRDCLYGTILPSGADAAISLAKYVSGSEEAFVELMNQKCAELGIAETTHFTNVVGAYGEDHYSTALDIAKILRAALENDLCREVLSCHIYTVTPSSSSEEGFQLSNWFLRRIEDKDTHGTVVAAKTGFVNESGNCAASYQKSNSGGHYICVTGNAPGAWPCIYDHVWIYDTYTE